MVRAQTDDRALPAIYEDVKGDVRNAFRSKHDLTTNKGVVAFLSLALNAFIIDPDDPILERNELNTIGYVSGVLLKGIAAVQAEENPAENIADLLKGMGGQVEITMTKEERKMYLTAGSTEKMAEILSAVKNDGRVVDLEQQPDGSYKVPPRENPPRTDAPMPATLLKNAINAGGGDVTTAEVLEIFGSSLGSDAGGEDLETFGFEEVFKLGPADTPVLAHRFEPYSIHNPDMPGVVIRRNRCQKCGISTTNTARHANEKCEVFGE